MSDPAPIEWGDTEEGIETPIGRAIEPIYLPQTKHQFVAYLDGSSKRHQTTGEWIIPLRVPYEYREMLSKAVLESSHQNLLVTLEPWTHENDVRPE